MLTHSIIFLFSLFSTPSSISSSFYFLDSFFLYTCRGYPGSHSFDSPYSIFTFVRLFVSPSPRCVASLRRFSSCSNVSPNRSSRMSGASRTKHMFLTRALEKILADKETRRSQYAPLRRACNDSLSKRFGRERGPRERKRNEYPVCDRRAKENDRRRKRIEVRKLSSGRGRIVGFHSSDDHGTLPNPDQRTYVDADQFILPFELACQSRHSRLVITALDCLQVK